MSQPLKHCAACGKDDHDLADCDLLRQPLHPLGSVSEYGAERLVKNSTFGKLGQTSTLYPSLNEMLEKMLQAKKSAGEPTHILIMSSGVVYSGSIEQLIAQLHLLYLAYYGTNFRPNREPSS